MKATHLTDEEIQQYALDRTACIKVIEHIDSCEQCKEKAEAYRLLFAGLQQQPQASFNFNLAELVMEQLPVPTPKPLQENVLIYIFIATGIAITAFTLFYFRKYVAILFESITPIFIYLSVTACLTLSVVLITDMYKNYKKKIHTLDLYKR